MKVLRTAQPPLPSQWGWAEIIISNERIYFNPLQTDHLREIKGYKRSGQLPCRTCHPSLTFQETDEPLSYLGGELPFFLLRTVFLRHRNTSPCKQTGSEHASCLPDSIWGWTWLMATWTTFNRCNIWSHSSWRGVGRKYSVGCAWRWSPLLESHSLVFHQGGDQKPGQTLFNQAASVQEFVPAGDREVRVTCGGTGHRQMMHPRASQELLLPRGCSMSLRGSWAQQPQKQLTLFQHHCVWEGDTHNVLPARRAASLHGKLRSDAKFWEHKSCILGVCSDSSSTKPSLLLQNPEEKLVSHMTGRFGE